MGRDGVGGRPDSKCSFRFQGQLHNEPLPRHKLLSCERHAIQAYMARYSLGHWSRTADISSKERRERCHEDVWYCRHGPLYDHGGVKWTEVDEGLPSYNIKGMQCYELIPGKSSPIRSAGVEILLWTQSSRSVQIQVRLLAQYHHCLESSLFIEVLFESYIQKSSWLPYHPFLTLVFYLHSDVVRVLLYNHSTSRLQVTGHESVYKSVIPPILIQNRWHRQTWAGISMMIICLLRCTYFIFLLLFPTSPCSLPWPERFGLIQKLET
jgi:hypothetical protein